jgi:hypothetical protein
LGWVGLLLDGFGVLHVGLLGRLCIRDVSRNVSQPWSGVFGMNEFECSGDVFGFLFFVLGSGIDLDYWV